MTNHTVQQKRPLPFFGGIGLSLRSNNSAYEWDLSRHDAESFIRSIGEYQRTALAVERNALPYPSALQIAGGEPFSQPDDLEGILDVAAYYKMRVEVTTLGGWVQSYQHAIELLTRFKEKVYPLSLYLTSSHIRKLGLSRVRDFLDAACALRMSVNVHCGLFPGETFPRDLLDLGSMNSHTVILRSFPLAGAASQEDAARWLLAEPPRHRRCSDMMGLLIAPNGEVYPCSRSYGIPALRLGSLHTDSVASIVETALSSHAMKHLRDDGPYHLYAACKSSSAAGALRSGYMDSCDFHRHALEDEGLRAVVAATEELLPIRTPAVPQTSPFVIFQEQSL